MRETSSRDFVTWKVYLERDVNTFHRNDYYFAQLAQEIRRVLSTKPEDIKLSSFLLKFENKKGPVVEKTPEEVEAAKAQRSMWSKSFWCGLVGLSAKDIKNE